jgi:hypothetical protein
MERKAEVKAVVLKKLGEQEKSAGFKAQARRSVEARTQV